MLEYLTLIKWNESLDFLWIGNPPMYVRLLALNALFLGLYGLRRASGASQMPTGLSFLVQVAVLGANLLVLFQAEVEAYLAQLINR